MKVGQNLSRDKEEAKIEEAYCLLRESRISTEEMLAKQHSSQIFSYQFGPLFLEEMAMAYAYFCKNEGFDSQRAKCLLDSIRETEKSLLREIHQQEKTISQLTDDEPASVNLSYYLESFTK